MRPLKKDLEKMEKESPTGMPVEQPGLSGKGSGQRREGLRKRRQELEVLRAKAEVSGMS